MIKILAGLPSIDGKYHGNMMLSLIQNTRGIHVDFAPVYRQRIEKARSMIFELFLTYDYTHLLFMDDDNSVDNALKKFVELDKDIISAVIRQRNEEIYTCVMHKESNRYIKYTLDDMPKEVFEVDACGMGFCLIKREVIEKTVKQFGNPFLTVYTDGKTARIMGEDISFCIKAKQLGYQIFADPTVRTEHIDLPKPLIYEYIKND